VSTEKFSSRRVRWVMSNALAGTGTQVIVLALNPSEYTREDW